ncbi:MAG: hypothetical protein ACREU2_16115 [Steroidobacteraceae bacterium]
MNYIHGWIFAATIAALDANGHTTQQRYLDTSLFGVSPTYAQCQALLPMERKQAFTVAQQDNAADAQLPPKTIEELKSHFSVVGHKNLGDGVQVGEAALNVECREVTVK